jgi:AcrR family transcriptional regulator
MTLPRTDQTPTASRGPADNPAHGGPAGPEAGPPERKTAHTRAAIQEHAMRLFREQGYAATTIEQIAEAAEISQSTFFRYFPSKEEVVLLDELDPVLIEAVLNQPEEMTPLQAIRRAIRALSEAMSDEEWAREQLRHELTRAVPELRAAMLNQFAGTLDLLAGAVAARTGRPADDPVVRTFAGAVVGVALATMGSAMYNPNTGFLRLLHQNLAHLENGSPLF